MNDEEKSGVPVPEDALYRLRKMFGPRLAAEIERWNLDASCQESTLQLLTRESLPSHVGYVLDVFAGRELSTEEREEVIARVVVAANEAIVREIRRRTGGEAS
jgi:hypothetical protein